MIWGTIPTLLISFVLASCAMSQTAGETPSVHAEKATDEGVKLAYGLGKKALINRDGKAAITQLSKCILERPDHTDCHWELGWAYFLEHEFEETKVHWEIVKKSDPKRSGLSQALERINSHLRLRNRSLAMRSTQVASFNPRRKPASTTIKIHAVGDTMLGTNYPKPMLPPQDTSPLTFAEELLKGADVTFANHEGTLCDNGTEGKCDEAEGACYAFRSPTSFAKLLKEAGFDLISLANNHVLDFGESCWAETEKALSAADIFWSGRKDTVARFERKGVNLSMIGFHAAKHTNSTLDIEAAQDLVKKEKKHKRIVIVSFHGGAEGFHALHTPKTTEKFMGEDRGDVTRFAHAMVDAGADLILGSGPHVVRAMEIYKNRLIAYSLGNFATYRAFNIWGFSGVGLILDVDIDHLGRFVSGRIIPTRQLEFGMPTYDEKMTAVDLVRLLSLEDFPKTAVIVAQDGTIGKKSELRRKIASKKK